MQNLRYNQRKENTEVYSAGQVESVLQKCGVEVVSDTYTNLLVLCPFHGNTNTPAMSVDKATGLFFCFSASCGESGNLLDLVQRTTKRNAFQAQRLIFLQKDNEADSIQRTIKDIFSHSEELPLWSQDKLDVMYEAFWKYEIAQNYMHGRGFTDETLKYFKIGYSQKKNMIAVPMHDVSGRPVGIIGRVASNTDKRFKNSKNLPTSRSAWNIHRAKRAGNSCIVCEASYDAMRIHQAGFPNVVALLGGNFSEHHRQQLSKYFDTIIIMTDMDKLKFFPNCRRCDYLKCRGHRPGRDLGRRIATEMNNKRIMWGCFSDDQITPDWKKDASDMTGDEIRQCIWNAKTNYEYVTKRMESLAPA